MEVICTFSTIFSPKRIWHSRSIQNIRSIYIYMSFYFRSGDDLTDFARTLDKKMEHSRLQPNCALSVSYIWCWTLSLDLHVHLKDTAVTSVPISVLGWAQSCSLVGLYWDPMNCSPPGSSVRGSFRARILDWIATSFPRGPSQPRDWTHLPGLPHGCWATKEAHLTHF